MDFQKVIYENIEEKKPYIYIYMYIYVYIYIYMYDEHSGEH